MAEKIQNLGNVLARCQLCPRRCGVNRLGGQTGFCRAGLSPRIARAALHFWEEPCISGKRGSGAVFFSHCNLRCVFCQNACISHQGWGKDISIERLAEIFLAHEANGAHNLNLVTPTVWTPHILDALDRAKAAGFSLPVVYNSSGYEAPETIEALAGQVDIYLPDLKYYSERPARLFSQATDYFWHASRAIELMAAQIGQPVFDGSGIMRRGMIVRHLALPGLLEDSKNIISYLFHTYGNSVYLSLMNQYTPLGPTLPPPLNRPLPADDYDRLVDYAAALGWENAFMQEGSATVSESFIPPFDLTGVD
ncbi:radical SAM protein [Acetonema longum]|uniref:Pyruvate formate-lyase 1 activating enzyme n=1 Tax=Acetonema longum DSM 6540 TaxID=1009370 RepID=F7NGI8_9FIRM|nr:radical SAM protein [Acetonema longum]EGO64792.1 pyruvate formate-lyase 1 activating enzyme [Acetonema longum DSM 6540]